MSEQKTLKLNIARVDGSLFTGDVVSVTVPGTEGEMTLLPNHTPLVSALRAGTINVRLADGTEQTFSLESGTLEISQNQVTVLL
jgi:F-type H+-transporting ATPase subunit epsilon